MQPNTFIKPCARNLGSESGNWGEVKPPPIPGDLRSAGHLGMELAKGDNTSQVDLLNICGELGSYSKNSQ